MRELLDGLDEWSAGGTAVAVARVVDLHGSGPREPGAAMAVSREGAVLGSLSGGCVEGAVVQAALEVLDTGERRVMTFGYSDDDAFAVGLTCGGSLTVAITPLDATAVYPALAHALRRGVPVALATLVAGGQGPAVGTDLLVCPTAGGINEDHGAAEGHGAAEDHGTNLDHSTNEDHRITEDHGGTDHGGTEDHGGGGRQGEGGGPVVRGPYGSTGTLGDPELDRVVARDAAGQLAAGISRIRHYGPHGESGRDEVTIFVQAFAPPPRLVVLGATDFASALVGVGKVLGYRITVCDARAPFVTAERFPGLDERDELVADWPHRLLDRIGPELTERDAVCLLTHEARFDVPAILAALTTRVGYLGALGSRRTHTDRLRRLREAGVAPDALARLRSPIGLDLGARTPEETAVSICAEIIAARAGAGPAVAPLTDTDGPIHRRSPLTSPVRG